ATDLAAAIAAELGGSIAYVDLGTGTPDRSGVPLETHPCRDLADVDRLRRSHAAVVMRGPQGHPLLRQIRALPGSRVDAMGLTVHPTNGSAASGILATPLQQRARRLLGRRVGLVLGAGGAKGLAHIGAVRSFERAGLRFDMLAGTSMGAIVATLIGLGWSSERMQELAERVRRNFRALLVDIGLSGSLLRGAKKRALLAELVDGKQFEDVSVPLWIVAADLVLQREFIFDRGDLGEALDASSAIPAIFPVVSLEDRQLVDGWGVNPRPAAVLRQNGAAIGSAGG